MTSDFSWDVSAGVYEDVYKWAVETRQQSFGD